MLLDIMMPGKSGIELLSEIIVRYPDTRVMMMTGLADTATAVKAMRDGALDYVTKPFNLDELTIRIEHALAQPLPDLKQVPLLDAEAGIPPPLTGRPAN